MHQSFHTLVNKLMKVKAREISAVAASFLFVFTLMAAYYILRPVRDAMSSDYQTAGSASLTGTEALNSAPLSGKKLLLRVAILIVSESKS